MPDDEIRQPGSTRVKSVESRGRKGEKHALFAERLVKPMGLGAGHHDA